MRFFIGIFVLLIGAVMGLAADNATLVTPCTSTCLTIRSKDVGAGVQAPVHVIGDAATGAPIYGTAGTANVNILTVQGIASMTKLLVTPDANSAVNVGQINGVTPLMGNGVTGTGSQRVTIASDNTAFTVNAAQSGAWTAAVTQSGTWNITNVSGTVSLPTGAATAAKQPALGTAGAASTDVLTVQGIASMTALKVDGSGVTQPVSGTVTANQGTSPWVGNTAQINGVTPLMGNGVTGTGSQRVTIASDNTAFSVNAAQSGTWTVQQGTPPWTVNPGTAANWGIGATGAAVPANAQYLGMTQGGNLTGLSGTSGNLNVQCANCSGSGVSTADEAAFTAGSSLFAGTGGFFQTTATSNALTNGQQGMWQMTANRAGFVNLRDSSGAEFGTVGNQLFVNCATGCAGGSFNNNADAVATSATNGQAAAWLYAFNGATWDRLRVDGSKNLNVNCAVGCAGGTFNNNADAVATSATNGQSAAWLYGFNGTTWDRLRVDGSKNLNVNLAANSFGTLTVGGTVTANAGTNLNTSALALESGGNLANISGAVVSQGTALGSIKELMTAGSVTTNAPTYTTGQISPLSLTTAGGVRIDLKDTATNTNNLNVNLAASAATVTVSGTVTANQGGAPWSQNVTQFGGTNVSTGTGASGAGIPRVTVANDSNILATQSGTWTVQQGTPPWSVVGNVASGGADSGNPVKTGGVFNTTQPTVTNAQRVDAQSTARGAAIVATGVDAFTVGGTVTANQGGTWTVQPGNTANTTPWLTSISQGGNTAAVNASSQLSVNCANCSGSGVSQQDLTGFTFGSGNMVPVGGVYSATPSVVPTGQAGVAQITANRAVHDNPRDSAGRELGSSLPGANNVPIQVNQATNFTQYNKTVFPTPADASGSMRTASVIYDGQHYADVVAANQIPSQTNGALVVVPSPKISLQCPFTVGINQTGNTQIVTNPGGKALHICGFGFVSATAQNVSLVEGTGSTCGTGTGALVGGTTASIAAAANGGLWNMTDRVTVPMQKAGDNLCVLQSAAGNVSGTLTYGIF